MKGLFLLSFNCFTELGAEINNSKAPENPNNRFVELLHEKFLNAKIVETLEEYESTVFPYPHIISPSEGDENSWEYIKNPEQKENIIKEEKEYKADGSTHLLLFPSVELPVVIIWNNQY